MMMATRLFRTALLSALFLACNSTSSPDGSGGGGTSTSNPATDPTGNGGAGRDAPPPSASDGGAAATGNDGGSNGGTSTDPYEPGPPRVQFIGRFDKSDPQKPRCSFAGCRIVARFTGTSVSVNLQEQFFNWMEAAPSEWDVMIDGTITQKIVMTAADTKFDLATGLTQGEHVVELYKRSEPQTGTTMFLGFDFAGGTLMNPPTRKSRHIEVIGDSSSAGFGIEGVGQTDEKGLCPGVNHAARYENFHKAYPALLGTMLDAEVYGSVLSGKGLVKNIWRPDTETLPIMFTRTIPMEQGNVWDFSEWKADVVVLMAGGNDFAIGQPVDDGPASLADFTQAMRDLSTKLRTVYPQSHIVLTVSPTVDDMQPPTTSTRTNIKTAAQTVTTERNQAGDAKTWFFEPNKAPPEEMTACMGHGNEAFHKRVANELAAFIKPKLGW